MENKFRAVVNPELILYFGFDNILHTELILWLAQNNPHRWTGRTDDCFNDIYENDVILSGVTGLEYTVKFGNYHMVCECKDIEFDSTGFYLERLLDPIVEMFDCHFKCEIIGSNNNGKIIYKSKHTID